MIRRLLFKSQYRFNSGLSAGRSSGSTSRAFQGFGSFDYEGLNKKNNSSTTPYSDKYYQPIISEGFLGFDKLIIPKDFRASNQEVDIIDEEGHRQQHELTEVVNSFKAPIKVAIGYGSGVFPQDGYEDPKKDGKRSDERQIDFINIVEDNDSFHRINLQQHTDHYSVKSPYLIKLIQGSTGIYFNPFVRMRQQLIKYGIISTNASLLDLSEWSSLYFAGRLHKPVNFVKDEEPMVKFLNQYNLKNAVTLSILLIESPQFTERQLYEQITKISYLGDFRMYIGGENPNKVRNIVNKQFLQFMRLYEPILQYFIHKNCLIIVDSDEMNNNMKTFRKNLTINNKIKLISTLPLQFRSKLYQMYHEKSIKEIVKDKNLSKNLMKIVSRTIQISSVKQTIRGIFSSGIIKSIKYAFAKQVKFWRGKMLEKKSHTL
ncbi:Mmp37-domain-containing protein [Suhomyces tanzawaensis NRRL Y-17324]|uniref:Phosphatidate cytidylyltransferase, mitochondrial n=1 Tax=Suhomyces tanzawaensis NRRL Y-17324 TaxID=984487 RepID=A0A1E4SL28_9ASCO|nr:Mmp37-domain-containing protein [Suhomyces tanzawaensis NRRL Y-17324]ODV80225.1 Mmp37-domain-containing protein [Suhomyces tanzawaensis NRRL Y-17324]